MPAQEQPPVGLADEDLYWSGIAVRVLLRVVTRGKNEWYRLYCQEIGDRITPVAINSQGRVQTWVKSR